ncbi:MULTISPECIES: DUF1259 domain-containing protein [unclassified Sphingomonas]|uniref:DUF1259 domain-containing protein n=1 Tax=unclassified Sphingomonas TaxID=196159 RepID=UPI000474E305|nr:MULTISPECIES: DUF1259 domain-containing protein [unclassified Sphingomonas]KTF67734.1 peptidase M23 [Sphingomonas sp. WG]
MRKSILAGVFAAVLAAPAWAAPDWSKVDAALGRPGTEQAGGVHRYGFPRSDLRVSLDGVAIKPVLALGSWAAFQPLGDDVMVMGDLVLTHEEVNPVMSRLLAGGFTVTALHNHLLRSSPATMYLHIAGHGDPVKLATALRAALAESRTPLAGPSRDSQPPSAGAGSSPPLDIDAAALDRLMGAKGKANGGVLQYSFPRAERLTDQGMETPPSMGTATAINFQPTGSGRAAITGDFVLVASEVDPVMRALRASGIEVTALHNHMLDDQPRLFFMHFWANQDAAKLAKGLRSALDKMKLQAS